MAAAVVFPGQGSQFTGMAEAPLLENPASLEVMHAASRIAGIDLIGLCNEGPEEKVARTDLCQLSVAAVSLAWWALLREAGLKAAAVAGHSLGEWCAACAAGSLGLEDALVLIRERGKAMLKASREKPGGMLALLGLTIGEVEDLLEGLEGERPALANHNAERQVVLAGGIDPLKKAAEAAAARGARCSWLKVGGPFHSPRMLKARREMERLLAQTGIDDPYLPFYTGLTGGRATSGGEVAACLAEGMTSTVRWHRLQRELASLPVSAQVEVGPGKILGRMASRDHPQKRFLSSPEALDMLGGA